MTIFVKFPPNFAAAPCKVHDRRKILACSKIKTLSALPFVTIKTDLLRFLLLLSSPPAGFSFSQPMVEDKDLCWRRADDLGAFLSETKEGKERRRRRRDPWHTCYFLPPLKLVRGNKNRFCPLTCGVWFVDKALWCTVCLFHVTKKRCVLKWKQTSCELNTPLLKIHMG